MSDNLDNDPLTNTGGAIFFLGLFLFASGSCTYFANWLVVNAEGVSGAFLMLLAIPVKLLSLPAALYQGFIAAVFGVPYPDFPMPFGYLPFSESVLYIWYLPVIGAVLYLLGKRSWHATYLTPVVAVLFPQTLAGRTRRSRKEADMFQQETDRSKMATELDDTLAELERTKHKLRRAKERHR